MGAEITIYELAFLTKFKFKPTLPDTEARE